MTEFKIHGQCNHDCLAIFSSNSASKDADGNRLLEPSVLWTAGCGVMEFEQPM
jgi:hypothetical protein